MIDISALLSDTSTITALVLIGLIVYAETGFLVGLFLPGDTLLVVVGVFAAHGDLPLVWSMVVICIAAILGDNTGYYIGRKSGPHIFKRHTGLLFRAEYVERAEQFYEKHGGKTILIARFFGYVRTMVPIIAGVAKMSQPRFIVYNVVGAIVWTLFFVLLGYWVGEAAAEYIERYFIPSLILGMLVILGPSIVYAIRHKLKK